MGHAAGGTAVPGLPSWLQPGSLLRRWAHRLFPFALGGWVMVFSLVTPLRPALFLFDGTLIDDAPTGLIALSVVASGVSAALVRRWRFPLFAISLAVWLALAMPAAGFVAS